MIKLHVPAQPLGRQPGRGDLGGIDTPLVTPSAPARIDGASDMGLFIWVY